MIIKPAEADPREVYHHLVHCVVPRPIGWISTRGADGHHNVAPYSFFQVVGAKPATVIFASTVTRHGENKDTLLNARETGEFCVNIVSHDVAEMMNKTAASLERGVSEFEHAGIETEPCKSMGALRVKAAHVHFECKLHQEVQLGEGPMSTTVASGLIQLMEIDDALLDENGMVDPHKLAAVGRMGGNTYCNATDTFELDRPS